MEHTYLRSKVIDSVESLWSRILQISDESGMLLFTLGVDNALLADYFSGRPLPSSINKPGLDHAFSKYRELEQVSNPFGDSKSDDNYRLFVSPAVWDAYFSYRSFHGRLGFLVYDSFRKGTYINWMGDGEIILPLINRMLGEKANIPSSGGQRIGYDIADSDRASQADQGNKVDFVALYRAGAFEDTSPGHYVQKALERKFLVAAAELMLDPNKLSPD